MPVIVALLTARFTAPSTNIVEANETLSLNVEIPVTLIPAPSVVIPTSVIPVILPLLSTVIRADLSKSPYVPAAAPVNAVNPAPDAPAVINPTIALSTYPVVAIPATALST